MLKLRRKHMKGDFHVRFRENAGVKLPCVTRLSAIVCWFWKEESSEYLKFGFKAHPRTGAFHLILRIRYSELVHVIDRACRAGSARGILQANNGPTTLCIFHLAGLACSGVSISLLLSSTWDRLVFKISQTQYAPTLPASGLPRKKWQ